jgi:excisionase family DNA binding protein
MSLSAERAARRDPRARNSEGERAQFTVHMTTPWLKINEAAEYARVSEPTIRREVRGGRLKAYRVGGKKALRFRVEDVDAWLLSWQVPQPDGR